MAITQMFFYFSCIFFMSCNYSGKSYQSFKSVEYNIINPKGDSIITRILPPQGYQRQQCDSNSYACFLRHLPVKPHGSKVHHYDGSIKNKRNVYIAVIDMDISKRDLQQCADAVMRLRGEYFYQTKQFDKIHFNFLSDGKPRYYNSYVKGDRSYKKFMRYMDYVFAYANTSSLHDELIQVADIHDMKTGDVFIQKGNPYGHAVTVIDMVENKTADRKLFLLAQSYMPAQETQVLVNPTNSDISPWYEVKEGIILTPEWKFTSSDLRRFKEK